MPRGGRRPHRGCTHAVADQGANPPRIHCSLRPLFASPPPHGPSQTAPHPAAAERDEMGAVAWEADRSREPLVPLPDVSPRRPARCRSAAGADDSCPPALHGRALRRSRPRHRAGAGGEQRRDRLGAVRRAPAGRPRARLSARDGRCLLARRLEGSARRGCSRAADRGLPFRHVCCSLAAVARRRDCARAGIRGRGARRCSAGRLAHGEEDAWRGRAPPPRLGRATPHAGRARRRRSRVVHVRARAPERAGGPFTLTVVERPPALPQTVRARRP